jgi:hypothetical protein
VHLFVLNKVLKGSDVERNRFVTCGLDSSRSGQILVLASRGDGNETLVFLNVSGISEQLINY